MRQDGFSLVELMVVIGMVGILLTIGTMNWNKSQTKSGIESEVKMLQADLAELRQQALYTKTARSVVISGQTYKCYSTTTVAASIKPVVSKDLRYPVTWSSGSGLLTFNTQGLASTAGTELALCVLPTNDLTVINGTAVDSLVISDATINLGQRTTGVCDSAYNNMVQK